MSSKKSLVLKNLTWMILRNFQLIQELKTSLIRQLIRHNRRSTKFLAPLALSLQKHALLTVRQQLEILDKVLLDPKQNYSSLKLIQKIHIEKFRTRLPQKFWCKIRRVGFSLRTKKVIKVGLQIPLRSLVMRFRCKNRSRITKRDKKLLYHSRSRFYKKLRVSLGLIAFSNRIISQLYHNSR